MELNVRTILLVVSVFLGQVPAVFSQADCGFLTGPSGLSFECQDTCVLVVPDFERSAETTGYDVDSIAYAPPLAPGTGTVQATPTNGFTNNIGLPFGFSFFNTDFFSFKASRKGFLTFNTGLTGTYNYPNQDLGSASLPPNSVMAPYAYISNSGGEIRTALQGEFPCRRFVISWENLPQTGCGSNELVTQVVLYETSNKVEMHIGQFESCLQITAVVGIQGGPGEGAYGPAEFDTGELVIQDKAFSYTPNGATQTNLVYLIGDEIVGQGDSISLCLEGTTELVIGANFPEILPPPPVAGSCDAIPDEACDTVMAYDFNLNANQSGSFNFPFDGELLGFAVTNSWSPSGGSWPGDMSMSICDPSGTCGVIEGFSYDLPGTLIGDWPFNWNTTSGGFYEACFAVPTGLLEGDGNWTLTVQNAWGGSLPNTNFEGSVTLFWICDPVIEEPDTSNPMVMDTILIQLIEPLGEECSVDDNGNGICDEEEGSYCGNGTVWNPASGLCEMINACTGDLNADGIVNVVDLLIFLPTLSTDCIGQEVYVESCNCNGGVELDPLCETHCAALNDAISSCEEAISVLCGESTVWMSSSQQCVSFNICPTDLNSDQSVTVADLLVLLAEFQLACEG